jgi:type I restriction enzyme R subunit
MVVTASIDRAIKYYEAISAYLVETNSPYRAIVAFSDFERDGAKVTEAQYNKFPSAEIPSKIREDPYRILVCADKFQTGYDEPLLHTMYVDKPLSGVKAVQTLSRLNRATPGKFDTAVLDFFNDSDTIKEAFDDYYRTTLLADETDPNKLYDLEKVLRDSAVYAPEHVEAFVAGYLTNAPRDQLDPILDKCAAEYTETMDEDEQVAFKGSAKAFVRTYDFLSAILPFSKSEWEKLSIFLTFLIPKLPAPVMDDATAGLLETVDLDSYRAEKQAAIGIILEDEDAEIEPVPLGSGGGVSDPEMARLTEILRELEDRFGNIPWEDKDRIHRMVTHDIPEKVAENEAYQLAQQNNDAANARIEMERALTLVMLGLMSDQTQLFKQFSDNADFKKWLSNTVFDQTYLKAS